MGLSSFGVTKVNIVQNRNKVTSKLKSSMETVYILKEMCNKKTVTTRELDDHNGRLVSNLNNKNWSRINANQNKKLREFPSSSVHIPNSFDILCKLIFNQLVVNLLNYNQMHKLIWLKRILHISRTRKR